MQRKRISLVESVASTAIGFSVAFATQLVVFPIFGWNPPIESNLTIAAIFTAVSLIRGYYVRRLFNWLHVKGHLL